MNRRIFLKFLAAGVAIAGTPIALKAAIRERLPIIYGDGIHDDSEGLQAAMNGLPFVARNDCVTVSYDRGRRTVHLSPGNFKLGTALETEGGK